MISKKRPAELMDEEEVIPPDEELRKRLFSSPSPEKDSQVKRGDEERKAKRKERGNGGKTRKIRKAGFRLSLLAVMLFLMLCALALVVTLHFNDRWQWITWREAQEGKNTPGAQSGLTSTCRASRHALLRHAPLVLL